MSRSFGLERQSPHGILAAVLKRRVDLRLTQERGRAQLHAIAIDEDTASSPLLPPYGLDPRGWTV